MVSAKEAGPQTTGSVEAKNEAAPAASATTPQDMKGLDEADAPQFVPNSENGASLEQDHSNHLDELAAPSPVKAGPSSRHSEDLEGKREETQAETRSSPRNRSATANGKLAHIYTLSYLVFFSLLGTLARLGLQALTVYPGAPMALGELWANVAGTLVMGFLAEDSALFRRELHPATQRFHKRNDTAEPEQAAAQLKKEHMATKKAIPAYVGLSVGFCGSFTTFSSFMRDAFLALSNGLSTAATSTRVAAQPARARHRHAGYSVEAVLAVLVLEVAASLAALAFGAHLAAFAEPALNRHSSIRIRAVLDPAVAVLAWPMWLGAVLVSVWPPHAAWRGQAVFALVFAPGGCLVRFYLARWLNARVPRFPLGTFAANVAGTLVLGMCFDLQRSSRVVVGGGGGVVGCQVLQGVMDGFCGCLTTVSTWVLELTTLRRGHAYVYGAVSLAAGLGSLVVVVGSVQWTVGFAAIECRT